MVARHPTRGRRRTLCLSSHPRGIPRSAFRKKDTKAGDFLIDADIQNQKVEGSHFAMSTYRLAFALIFAAHLLPLSSALHAAEPTYRRVLPGVIHAREADGARVETSTWLVNLGTSSASFEFEFLPVSKGSAPPAQSRTLGAGETLRLNNALLDLFGLSEGEGALIVRGDQPFELRGVNASGTNPSGASGQGANWFASAELLGPDASAHSIWLANRSEPEPEFLTDITAVLTAPNTAVTVSVYDASGVLRGIEVVSSEEPAIWRASASRFLPDPEIPIGRVKFAVTAGEATGFISVTGRVVGNGFIAQPERIVPATAEGANLLLNGVTSSTSLRIFNPNETEQEMTIEALGFPGGPATIRRMAVAPNGLLEIPSVLGASGFVSPEGATGALRIRAPQRFLAAGRGLPMAVSDETGFTTPNQPVTLVGLNENVNQPGVRSRIALLSGARGAIGLLRLRNTRGFPLATSPIRLESNEWQGKALGAWFPDTEIPTDARVDIELENGSAHGYAEILDNLTQSRVVVTSAPVPVEAPATPTARRLVFSALPSSFTVGTPFVATIQALRADNSVDTRFVGSVDLRVASGPGGFQAAATASQTAVAGIASFRDLRFAVAGRYTLTALGASVESAVSAPIEVAPAPVPAPMVIRLGTFAGQNGYTTEGTLQIERAANGSETLRLNPNFRVSSGSGTITIWLARSSGALNAANSVRVGTMTRVFAGEFAFPIPSPGSSGFTHVIVYCDPFRINFGAAQLRNP